MTQIDNFQRNLKLEEMFMIFFFSFINMKKKKKISYSEIKNDFKVFKIYVENILIKKSEIIIS